MKSIIRSLILGIGCLLTFSACESDDAQSAKSRLSIIAAIDEPETRAVVQVKEGTTFAVGDKIGVFVKNANGSNYSVDGVNAQCEYVGNNNWEFKPWVELSATEGTVYAYYPYVEGQTTTNVQYDLNTQIDFLYAKPNTTNSNKVKNTSNTANLKFYHALTWITFDVKKTSTSVAKATMTQMVMGNYTEDSKNTLISDKATIDVTSGSVTPISNIGAELTSDKVAELSSSTGTKIDMIVLPVNMGNDGRVRVELLINGQIFEASLKGENWEAGKHYTYPVIANVPASNFDTGENGVVLYIGVPTITPWTTGNPNTKLGTLEGDIEGVPGELVDLGLPSGTLWCDRNLGASSPTGFGLYYAHGEVTTKQNYSDATYLYRTSSGSYITVGTYNSSTGMYEAAKTANDVVYKLWGGGWHTPSAAQAQELGDNCTTRETTVNGIKCVEVTSKINGKKILLPHAGLFMDTNVFDQNSTSILSCCYRTSSTNSSGAVVWIHLGVYEWNWTSNELRMYGMSIRPVYK